MRLITAPAAPLVSRYRHNPRRPSGPPRKMLLFLNLIRMPAAPPITNLIGDKVSNRLLNIARLFRKCLLDKRTSRESRKTAGVFQ